MRAEILKLLWVLLAIICVISCREQPKDPNTSETERHADNIDNSRLFDHRPFNAGGDLLISVDDITGEMICKATFTKQALLNLLSNCPDDNCPDDYWVKITTGNEWFGFGRRNFLMSLYTGNGGFIASKWANYPCPKDCIPPANAFFGAENTFDVADLNKVLTFTNCTFVNIHSSKMHNGGAVLETHSMYPLTGSTPQNAVSHANDPDHAFTSILYIQ